MKTTLLRPQRDLDLKGGSLLHQKVSNLITQGGRNHCWIIDMSRVKTVNNFGLMTLMAIRKIALKQGCQLYLFNLQEELELIFEVTGFDQQFDIVDSDHILLQSNPPLVLC